MILLRVDLAVLIIRLMEDQKQIRHFDSVGWLVNSAALKVNELMSNALQALNLTQGQFAIMKTLSEGDNITQKEIGKVVSMPAYAMTRNLDVLEQVGLLERKVDERSRRSFRICLTGKGRKLSPKLFDITRVVNEEFVAGLTQTEIEQLTKLLKKIVA